MKNMPTYLITIAAVFLSYNLAAMKRTSENFDEIKPLKKSKIKSPFCHAIKSGDAQAIRRMLEEKVGIDIPDGYGVKPIIYAVHKGDLDLVKDIITLMETQGTFSEKDRNDAVVLACARGHENIVLYFFRKYSSIARCCASGRGWNRKFKGEYDVLACATSPLNAAVISGNKQIVHFVIKEGACHQVSSESVLIALSKKYTDVIETLLKANQIPITDEIVIAAVEHNCGPLIEVCGEMSKGEERLKYLLLFAATYKNNKEVYEKVFPLLTDIDKREQVILLGAMHAKNRELVKEIIGKNPSLLDERITCFIPKLNFADEMFKLVPLCWAIKLKNLEHVKLLISLGASLDAPNFSLGSVATEINAVTFALLEGAMDIVDFLRDKGARIDAYDRFQAAVDVLSRVGMIEAVGYLLTRGAPLPEQALAKAVVKEFKAKRHQEIHNSAASGDLETIKKIMLNDPNVDYMGPLEEYDGWFTRIVDSERDTLFIAVNAGHLHVAEFLLDKANDSSRRRIIDLVIKNNDTKFFELFMEKDRSKELAYLVVSAARAGRDELLKLVFKKKSLFGTEVVSQALGVAAQSGHRNCVELLIKQNPDLDYTIDCDSSIVFSGYVSSARCTRSKRTALSVAHTPEIKNLIDQAKREKSIKMNNLLEKLLDDKDLSDEEKLLINDLGTNGKTPLICCLEQRNVAGIKRLLSYNVDVQIRDKWGMPPLVYAAASGEKALVELVCPTGKAGMDCVRAVRIAAACGFEDVVKYIFDRYQKTELLGKDAMGAAVTANKTEIVKFLLDSGIKEADVDLAIGSPLLFVRSKPMAQLLLDSGISRTGSLHFGEFTNAWLKALERFDFQLAAFLFDITPVKKEVLEKLFVYLKDRALYELKAAETLVLYEILFTQQEVFRYREKPKEYSQSHCKMLSTFFENPLEEGLRAEWYERFAQKAVTGKMKQTLLIWACIFGDGETVEKLVTMGLPEKYINHQDIHGRTALMYALLYGNAECALTLIHHKCVMQTPEGETVAYVNHCGDGINLMDKRHRKALFYAVFAARCDHSVEIVESGKAISISKSKYSREYGALKVIDVLLNLGARFGLGNDIALAIKVAATDGNWMLALGILKLHKGNEAMKELFENEAIFIRQLEEPERIKSKPAEKAQEVEAKKVKIGVSV